MVTVKLGHVLKVNFSQFCLVAIMIIEAALFRKKKK